MTSTEVTLRGRAPRAVVILVAALVVGMGTGAVGGDAAPAEWFARMRALSESAGRLLVAALPARRAWTDAERRRVVADAKQVAALARDVRHMSATSASAAPDRDPSLALLAGLFADEAGRLAGALERTNDVAYARDLARGVATYCVACHTRSDRFAALRGAADPAGLAALHPLDRAEILLAVHRFDDARKELHGLLASDRYAQEDPQGWGHAVERALILEVRTRRDPDAALALVERVLNSPVPAVRDWEDADGWRRSLLAWRAEGASTSAGGLFDARRLIDDAELTARVPGDRTADVLYLRATSALHDFLATQPAPREAARAYELLAIAYRRLDGLGVWSLSRLYEEACIRAAPRTDLARGCFARWRDEVLADEVGNGGGALPADVAAHARALAKLAGLPAAAVR